MKLNKLLSGIQYKKINVVNFFKEQISDVEETEITGVKFDSRQVEEGDLFVAICGAESDGHNYIASALNRGAKAVMLENEAAGMGNIIMEGAVVKDIPILQVEDTKATLSKLARNFYEYPETKLKTVAITGTKGKTSVSMMIKNILEKAGHTVGVIGTMGVFIKDYHEHLINTTPDPVTIQKYMDMMVKEGCDVCVMEVSSQALMLSRVEDINFDIGIFTNLSPDHIGENEHADYDDYKYWKKQLFKQCKTGIFNADDKETMYMVRGEKCDILAFGEYEGADLRLDGLEYVFEPGFLGIEIKTSGIFKDTFKISSPGDFSAHNAMAAMCVANLMDVDSNLVKEALSNFHVRGRVEEVKVSDRFTLLIDYAHNAMSMESLLETIKKYNPKRVVSLFGCGGNRSKLRRFEMGEISGKLADFSILTADNSRFENVDDIIADIEEGIKKTDGKYTIIPDRKEAIKYAIENAKDGDIVLLLGKGHEDYQEIEGVRHPFDEREIVADILSELKEKGFK